MTKIDPYTDERLDEAHRALYGEVYPLLDDIAKRLGKSIDKLVLANMARRLATRKVPLNQLLETVSEHYQHQRAHNERGH